MARDYLDLDLVLAIAGAAGAILIVAVLFSKRSGQSTATDTAEVAAA